jgi:hypothetical protein
MSGFMHTSDTPRHTKNLKPITLSDGAVLELEHQALMAPESPDPVSMFARGVDLRLPTPRPAVESSSADEHPLM